MGDPERGEDGEAEEDQEVPETRIEVEIPKINTDLGSHQHFVKLPNFLSVETRPFDPMTYEDEIDEDEVLDEEGRTRMKLKVENTMRWRFGKDSDGNDLKDEFGELVRESNTRIVRWSDGSMSLHLGNEVFDVHTMLLQGDYNHLFVRQGTGLQGQSVFKTKLTFRPHSTDSFTHRKMTMSLADRSTKTQKIRVLPMVGKDPESQRNEMIKKEEERLRASIRRESQQRRIREKAHSRGVDRGYLEGEYENSDDDEGAVSLAAIKKSYKPGAKKDNRPNIYSSSESDSDSDDDDRSLSNKKGHKARQLQDSDNDSGGSGSGSGSGSDDDKPKRKRVVSSGDESGSGAGSGAESGGEGGGGGGSGAGSPAGSGGGSPA